MINLIKTRLNLYSKRYYSQFGEDIIINTIFNSKEPGFYIDVGAYHPIIFSNTYLLYKKGWCGINVDAMPGSMKIFNKKRKFDINIENPVFDIDTDITYYSFKEQAYNTIDINVVDYLNKIGINFVNKYELKTMKLENIIKNHKPELSEIDFLNIDAEGVDFNVLKSLNFDVYQPKLILIEIWHKDIEELFSTDIFKFLKNYNYFLYSKILNSVFFIREDFYKRRFKND